MIGGIDLSPLASFSIGFDLRTNLYGDDLPLVGRWAWSASDGLRRLSVDLCSFVECLEFLMMAT